MPLGIQHRPRYLALCFLAASACAAPNTWTPPASPGAPAQRTCVVLSVGSARGLAHIGAIQAIKKAGYRIDCVVGTSMGSLVGGLYASAPQEPLDARARAFLSAYVTASKGAALRNTILGAILGAAVGRAQQELGEGKRPLPAVLGAIGGAVMGALAEDPVDHDRFVSTLDTFVGSANIQDLPIPYATLYQELPEDGAIVRVARTGPLSEAVGHSVRNPLIFKKLRGELEDGSLIDPGLDRVAAVPVQDACTLFPDARIIAINVTSSPAFYNGDMTCPLLEVQIPHIQIDLENAMRGGEDFDRVVQLGHQKTAAALRATRHSR